MQYKTGIFFFVTTQLFVEANTISTHVVEILFWWSLPRTNKTMVLFWNPWPSTVIQVLSDNRYFTGVGFFLRDLNTKHWLQLSANKIKVQILCGMNLDAEDWDVYSDAEDWDVYSHLSS